MFDTISKIASVSSIPANVIENATKIVQAYLAISPKDEPYSDRIQAGAVYLSAASILPLNQSERRDIGVLRYQLGKYVSHSERLKNPDEVVSIWARKMMKAFKPEDIKELFPSENQRGMLRSRHLIKPYVPNDD